MTSAMHPLKPHLKEMKESLVREAIVFPFLQRLGYQVAGPARVRTEAPLRYSLGRKKPSDPVLKGFCDYVCEVESYGRWVIEAKGGAESLTANDAEQAHTYAHHPAVAGFFYLVTNGGLFRLYDRNPTQPVLEWTLGEMDSIWPTISNLLGPDAIRRRTQTYKIDVGKPLGQGLGSTVKIAGGYLTYDQHTARTPEASALLDQIKGMRATFTGRDVSRTDSGLIKARVELAGPYKEWDDLNTAAGITGYDFESAVEFISADPDHPTILQGTTHGTLRTGQTFRFPGRPAQRLPMGMIMTAYMEAVGFVEENRFKGAFRIAYDYAMDPEQPLDLALIEGPDRAALDQFLQIQPREAVEAFVRQMIPAQLARQGITSDGSFEMVLQ
jgi:hypothetical protein